MSLNDKDIENIQTVDITVTAESMDAHVQCLKDNGYKVKKPFALFTAYTLFFFLGVYISAHFLNS